jgi:hypothetical protein
MDNFIYLYYTLEKINRGNVRKEFNTMFNFAKDYEDFAKNLFLDLLVIAITEKSRISSPEETLFCLQNKFDDICEEWQSNVCKFDRNFTRIKATLRDGDRKKINEICSLFCNHEDRTCFLKKLALEVYHAEIHGVPYDDPVEFPDSIITTSKRYTFFTNLVPLDTKWRK